MCILTPSAARDLTEFPGIFNRRSSAGAAARSHVRCILLLQGILVTRIREVAAKFLRPVLPFGFCQDDAWLNAPERIQP